jgi:hypothetical protein
MGLEIAQQDIFDEAFFLFCFCTVYGLFSHEYRTYKLAVQAYSSSFHFNTASDF